MNKPRFSIGDEVFYVTSSCLYGISVPCPVCFGKRKVTVILGNDERVDTECGHCAHGVDRPSGFSKTWEPLAHVRFGVIKGISDSSEGWRYSIGCETLRDCEIFLTREQAMPLMEQRLSEEIERRKIWERDHFQSATQKQIWSAGYHRSQIKYHERSADWHRMRLCMIKEKLASTTEEDPSA